MLSSDSQVLNLGHKDSVPTIQIEVISSTSPQGEPPRHPGWILSDPDVIDQIDQTAGKLGRRYGHTSSDIEDIRQDIRLHLFQKESLYDPVRGTPGAFANTVLKSWLWTSVRYLKQQRRRGRMYRRPLSKVEIPPELDGIDQASARVESADLLNTCLSRLSEDEVWLLRLVLENGQERAAALSEIPRRQLRHRLCFICTTCSDLHSFSEKAAKP
jgi:DNA-directed RNA polymerase specialized sigma24 family protein